MLGNFNVIPIGFEPMTYCLEGSCSIQLSYGTIFKKAKVILLNNSCKGNNINLFTFHFNSFI